jgi:hypothetical protein
VAGQYEAEGLQVLGHGRNGVGAARS